MTGGALYWITSLDLHQTPLKLFFTEMFVRQKKKKRSIYVFHVLQSSLCPVRMTVFSKGSDLILNLRETEKLNQ